MPQSLRARFNGNSQEVIDYARRFGVWKCMDKYGIKDYIAWRRFAEEVGGDPDLGTVPTVPADPKNLAEALVEQFAVKIIAIQARAEKVHQEDQKRIARLEAEIALYRASDVEGNPSKILEFMKGMKLET